MSTNSYYEIANYIKNKEKENRIQRIKETKQLENLWSKKVVQANRETEQQKKLQEEYKEALEQYKNILSNIEELKQSRQMIIKNQEETEIENERERQRQIELNIKNQERKKNFEIFMQKKEVEAFNYLKEIEDRNKLLDEELHRYEKKKQTKITEDMKSKEIVNKYNIKKEKEIYEEKMNASNPGTMDILYSIAAPTHNNGNNIDYSTTRFHNVTIQRHNSSLLNASNLSNVNCSGMNGDICNNSHIINNINTNAFDKAKIESENTRKILNDKNSKLKEFKKNEEMNYKEQIRRKKAKENLEKLNDEFEKLKKLKKNTTRKKNENKSNSKPKDLTDTKNDWENLVLKNIDKLDNDYIIAQKNEQQLKNKFKYYEEPVARDQQPMNEVINRVSPVDLNSYQKVEIQEKLEYEHRKPQISNPNFILSKKQNANKKYYCEDIDIKKTNNDFNLLNELQIKNCENTGNANVGGEVENDVKMFINQINDTNSNFNNNNLNSNSNLNTNFINDTNLSNNSNNNYNQNNFCQTASFINNNNFNNNSCQKNFSQSANPINIFDSNSNSNNYNQISFNQNNFNNNDANVMTKNQNVLNNNSANNNEINNNEQIKKDKDKDKKWKYNKQELYERKKKMLKDKSNFK